MKSWTAEQIRTLRLRLGWSAADFARHFSCSYEKIQNWERGEEFPSPHDTLVLEDLACCVDSFCDQTRTWSLADLKLGDSHLDQIHKSEIEI